MIHGNMKIDGETKSFMKFIEKFHKNGYQTEEESDSTLINFKSSFRNGTFWKVRDLPIGISGWRMSLDC
jgi:hypothetical protein